MARAIMLSAALVFHYMIGGVCNAEPCLAHVSGQCAHETVLGVDSVAEVDVSLLQTRVQLESSDSLESSSRRRRRTKATTAPATAAPATTTSTTTTTTTTTTTASTTLEYFNADAESNCATAYMIITAEECAEAAGTLGYTYTGEKDRDSYPAGCYWLTAGPNSLAFFNSDLTGAPSSTSVGGMCALVPATTTTTTLAYFNAEGGENCDTAYMIISAEDCASAAVVVGYSYSGTIDKSMYPAGCFWDQKDSTASFNTDFDGAPSFTGQGGICALVPATTTTTTITYEAWQSPYFVMDCDGTQILTTEEMTFAEYDAAVEDVQSLYNSLPTTCNATYCPQADWAGCVLRIAGHDFMDYVDGEGGGSDGCIDFDDADNAGLAECIYSGEFGISIRDAYKNHCTTISLADFFVISAEAVMNVSREHTTNEYSNRSHVDFRSRFKWGRTTATSCAFAEHRLPNPENSCSAVNLTFVQRMGLSWTQSAALMGVHTLGRASVNNSGYNGWWSDAENSRRFNNNYFIAMLLKGWGPETSINGNANKNQWERIDAGVDEATLGKEMMLNTDLCLYFTMDDEGEVEMDAATAAAGNCTCTWPTYFPLTEGIEGYNGGKYCGTYGADSLSFEAKRAICCGEEFSARTDDYIDCGEPSTPLGPAASGVRRFANDEDAWLVDFYQAWKTATGNGFDLTMLQD